MPWARSMTTSSSRRSCFWQPPPECANFGDGNVTFALPFVLFPRGQAGRPTAFFQKTLIIIAKAIEVAAMLAGAMGIATLQWGWILLMVFCMGLQFHHVQPGLNSSVPELFNRACAARQCCFQTGNNGHHTAGHCPGWLCAGSKLV